MKRTHLFLGLFLLALLLGAGNAAASTWVDPGTGTCTAACDALDKPCKKDCTWNGTQNSAGLCACDCVRIIGGGDVDICPIGDPLPGEPLPGEPVGTLRLSSTLIDDLKAVEIEVEAEVEVEAAD